MSSTTEPIDVESEIEGGAASPLSFAGEGEPAPTAAPSGGVNVSDDGSPQGPPSSPPEPSAALDLAPVPGGGLPVVPESDEFERLCRMAVVLSSSKLAPAVLRDKPADALLVLLTGRDLGLSPTAALRKCYVIDGQVTVAPALLLALVRQRGLGRIWPDPENDDVEATAHGQRFDEPDGQVHSHSFGIADAQRAGLVKDNPRSGWQAYPQRMCWWRAVGYLIADIFPEVSFGTYSAEEVGGAISADGEVIDVSTVEVPDGFDRASKAVEPDKPLDADTAQDLGKRLNAIPPGSAARCWLIDRWRERELVGIDALTEPQGKLAEAFVAEAEKRWETESREAVANPAPQAVPDDRTERVVHTIDEVPEGGRSVTLEPVGGDDTQRVTVAVADDAQADRGDVVFLAGEEGEWTVTGSGLPDDDERPF